jgi:hypothetical protein
MITDHIANNLLPSEEDMEKFHNSFLELVEKTGVKAAYIVSGSSFDDSEELEIRTGGEKYQLQFLRIILDYAKHKLN